jgi:hypothetical protein
MREDAILKLLHETNEDNSILDSLVENKLIEKLQYSGHTYYMRKFRK